MLERDIDSQLLDLQANSKSRHPFIIKSGLKFVSTTISREIGYQSLNEIGDRLLTKLNTSLEVKGEFHHSSTLIVSNHPSWFLDFLAVSAAYTPNSDLLKVITRDEIMMSIPESIKTHFIPVSVPTKFVLYQPGPRNISGRHNVTALNLAAANIVGGGNILIFPQGTTDDKFIKTNTADKKWKPGVGIIGIKVLKMLSPDSDAFVQPLQICIQGAKRNPLSKGKRHISLNIGNPVSLRNTSAAIQKSGERVDPLSLTAFIDEYYNNLFSK